jgi:hypothetical protein
MRKLTSTALLACTFGMVLTIGASGQQADTNGGLGGTGAAPLAAAPPAPTRACLQLHIDSTIFNFNVTINPNVYPYAITGGTITGSICQAPWTVTGGSLSNSLRVNGQHPPSPNCSTTIAVVGNFENPSSYIGTYGFNGSSTQFNHHTLFLGYDRPSCP